MLAMSNMVRADEKKPFTITDPNNTIPCVFCRSAVQDEVNLGPIYMADNVVCHYYCMLFSAALSQGGSDDQGILGFLANDIMKEVRRSTRLKCTFCHKSGASIGCCKKTCKCVFHFPCGLNGGIQYQFLRNYEAFCPTHATPQIIPKDKFKDWNCPVCLINIPKNEAVMANCCEGAIFHLECLKRTALNAGYFFKCPMCNATKKFIPEMRRLGVFVPEQDASWEREPGAFEELYTQYSKCDAEVCECPKGREYIAAKGGFLMARCRLCGASAVHRQCGKLKTISKWACQGCLRHDTKPKKTKTNLFAEEFTVIDSDHNHGTHHNTNRKFFQGLKKQLIPPQDYDDEEIDLSKIKIHPSCYAYFPYIPEQLAEFQHSKPAIIPDWRGLTLRSNVVDWLGAYMRKVLGMPPALERLPPNADMKMPEVIIPTVQYNNVQTLTKVKKKKSRVYKGSRWRRGVIHNRRRKVRADTDVSKIMPEDSATVMEMEVDESLEHVSSEQVEMCVDNEEQLNVADSSIFKSTAEGPSFKKPSVLGFNPLLLAFGSKRESFSTSVAIKAPASETIVREEDSVKETTFTDSVVNETETKLMTEHDFCPLVEETKVPEPITTPMQVELTDSLLMSSEVDLLTLTQNADIETISTHSFFENQENSNELIDSDVKKAHFEEVSSIVGGGDTELQNDILVEKVNEQ